MSEPHYTDASVTLWHGDALEVLAGLPDASVDAVVTDPPYNLTGSKKGGTGEASLNLDSPAGRARIGTGGGGFMGQRWDDYDGHAGGFQGWCEAWAAECLRVLKPGGHLLAFGGSRTWHRLAGGIEDAGFEIRDSIAWLYGSGFPKSLDVSKAIDSAQGAVRERMPAQRRATPSDAIHASGFGADGWSPQVREAATAAAAAWQGWGTALKPAFEPIVVARKPLAGTVAANVLAHGTGALNIDACRLGGEQAYRDKCASVVGLDSNRNGDAYGEWSGSREDSAHDGGRWPANVVLDESQAAALDQQSGETTSRVGAPRGAAAGDGWGMTATGAEYSDIGGASRFFYIAKADRSERPRVDGVAHPTVKPLDLMRWLVRLVTPPGGTVLEPFAGSGTTVEACLLEDMRCIAIEREDDYLPLIRQRIDRRRDPVAAVRRAGDDAGLFGLLDDDTLPLEAM